ncbi:MAG: MGMT family protein [Clostridia bacterium]|nr:MGMT family protein [Clostridia bacterium]
MDRTSVLSVAASESFWGRVALAWTDRGLVGLGWEEELGAVAEEAARRVGAVRVERLAEAEARRALARRWPGLVAALAEGEAFAGPYDLPGAPPFFARAWEACRRIPKGEARSYAWLAREAGSPRAFRAAGLAMRANPVPLLTPCHRVLPTAGGVGRYGMGGPETKARLLALEGFRGVQAG